MFRKPTVLILLFSCLIVLGSAKIFAQTARIDKTIIARYENGIETGKIAEIERSLFDLALANPNNPEVLGLLAKLRVRQNRLSEAAALYKRILSLDANSVAARINLARLFRAAGKFDEARQMLTDVDANANLDQDLRLDLAATFLLVNEPEKALAATEKLLPKIKLGAALPIVAASRLKLNDLQKLRDLIEPMKKSALNHPAITAPCAEILQKAGMSFEAVDLLRTALAAAPNNFDNLILLAKFEIAKRNLADAKLHLNQAAKVQPRATQIFVVRALLEEAAGNSGAAFELLKQARLTAPDSTEILAQLVVTAVRANQSRAAIEAAQTLLAAEPNEPENLYLLGAAFLQSNNVAEALRHLQRYAELRPADSRGCLALGMAMATQSDQIDAARGQLVRCIEIDAKNFEARYQLGLSYKAQGETAKALQYLEQTIEYAPDYALALRDLGALYLQSGAEQKARAALEKAVALAPNDAEAHFQLSRLYNLIGETALAKRHFETFQKLKNSGGNSQ